MRVSARALARVCVCVCVCVRERERERQTDRQTERNREREREREIIRVWYAKKLELNQNVARATRDAANRNVAREKDATHWDFGKRKGQSLPGMLKKEKDRAHRECGMRKGQNSSAMWQVKRTELTGNVASERTELIGNFPRKKSQWDNRVVKTNK